MEFRILGSSSAGNCALIVTEEARVLIDAGFTGKKIAHMLSGIGVGIETLDAVFLTHEHGDHTAGLRGLSKYTNIQFFTNRDTAQALQPKLSRPLNWQLFETGTTFGFKDLEVTNFSIPHDAYDPVGYVIRRQTPVFGETNSLAWVTDLGYIPALIETKVKDVDILVLEANYDDVLLQEDEKRPWSLKQRIQSRHGHLSNKQAHEFLSKNLASSAWKKIYLGHLSRDCNCPKQVSGLFEGFSSEGCSVEVITEAHVPEALRELV